MRELNVRNRNIITGLIAITLVFALISLGVKFAFGALDAGYKLTGSFETAGQGLIPGSDVKMRGVNIGSVRKIELVDGRALVTMKINDGEQVPRTTQAVIRPKTLFGEKFVDLVPGEGDGKGPYYRGGEAIENTTGGFELEQVLSDAYPLLKDIAPQDIMTVLSTLARGGEGLGENVNRTLANARKIFDVQAAHDADTREFLDDFATVAGELGRRGDDLAAAARSLNVALPTLNDNGDSLTLLLSQAGRLAGDLADLLENHEPLIDELFDGGQRSLLTLYVHRDEIVPLVIGLREYLQTFAEAIHVPVGDGTYMGAVHGILSQELCLLLPCPGAQVPTAVSAPPASAATAEQVAGLAGAVGGVTTGVEALLQLVLGLGPR